MITGVVLFDTLDFLIHFTIERNVQTWLVDDSSSFTGTKLAWNMTHILWLYWMKRTRFRTSTSTWLLGLPNQICPTLRIVSPAIIRPIEPKFSIFGQSSTLLDYFRFLYNKNGFSEKNFDLYFLSKWVLTISGIPGQVSTRPFNLITS